MNLLLGWKMSPAHERFVMSIRRTNAPQFHPGIV